MTAHASIYARNPSTLSKVELLEENETLREIIRQYEESARPPLVLPRAWRLTGREADFLLVLYGARSQVVHRERMLIGMYGLISPEIPEPKIADVYLCKVRRKLMMAQARIEIETFWGRGWRLPPESHERLRIAIEAVNLPRAA